MYRKDLNERSPLRIFERSIHGGLGKGNIGVVMSRAGVGKTAFLVGVALDDLMRDRKVLHINLHDNVDKVREFYDEVFQTLAKTSNLENSGAAHVEVERNRMILSYLGGSFSMEKLNNSLDMLREQMNFVPDAIVLDGYPSFKKVSEEQMQELKKLATSVDAELWLAAQSHREGDNCDERGVPDYIAQHEDHLSVIVTLETQSDHVSLALRKDHSNPDVADLQIELDPQTLLLKWR